MTEGSVQEKYNHFTLVIFINNHQSYVQLKDVLDYNGEELTIDDIQIGDLVLFQNEKYYIQKPKLYPISLIEAHPYYNYFKKDFILDFTHFRKIQSGERCRDLTIGISLIESIVINKSSSTLEKLRNMGLPDSPVVKIAEYLKSNMEANCKIDQILMKIESKLLLIEIFASELRMMYGEDDLFTQLDICLCRFNSNLEYVGGNNQYFENRIDLLCTNQNNYWILYKKDFFFALPNKNLEFLLKIDPRPSKELKKKMIDEKTEEIENLILKVVEKAVNFGVFETVHKATDDYFKYDETINSRKFHETVRKIECFCCRAIIKDDEVKLPCGHKFRLNCFVQRVLNLTNQKVVLLEEEKASLQPLACICNEPIPEEILKKNISNYSKYLKDSEARIRINCKRCKYRLEKKAFLTKCMDYCITCQILFMRLGYFETCHYCEEKITAQEMSALSNVKIKCDKCNSNLPSLQAFPYLICEHNFCFKCAKACLINENKWNCPKGCKKEIKIDQAYWYLKGQCIKCKNEFFKYEDYFMYKNCNCLTCKDCMIQSKENKCEICKIPYSGYIQYLLQEFKDLKAKRMRDCPVCGEKKDIDDMIMFQNCAHFICPDCMKGTAKAAYENSEIIKIFKCFDPECNAAISEEQLEEFFSLHKKNLLESTEENNYWDKVNYLKIKQDIKLSKCPKCPAEFLTGKARRVICFSCGYNYCTKCFEDFHPPDDSCQSTFIKRRIAEIEQMYPNEPISQCPECKSPFLKDDHCNHVTCKDCKIDFCFVCSAIRSPILAHGNHYHRPQCTDYGALPKGEVDKVSDKCTQCVKVNGICPRPANLAVRGRYADGETGY
jgi:hypothetical protein